MIGTLRAVTDSLSSSRFMAVEREEEVLLEERVNAVENALRIPGVG
jgi:hypothetical protein